LEVFRDTSFWSYRLVRESLDKMQVSGKNPGPPKKDRQFISGNNIRVLQGVSVSGAQKRFLPALFISGHGESVSLPVFYSKILVIGCIEAFEVTIFIRLLFTGFECEKGTIGMFLADIGDTEPQRLKADCVLLTAFTLYFFCHRYFMLEFFTDTSF